MHGTPPLFYTHMLDVRFPVGIRSALCQARSGLKGLESVAGGFDAVFVVKAGRDGCGTPGVERFFKHGTDFASNADGCVVLAEDGAGDFEAAHTAGVVGLVMRVGHDELRLAGFEALRGGADAPPVGGESSGGEELG